MDQPAMRRRAFVGACATAALAGCLGDDEATVGDWTPFDELEGYYDLDVEAPTDSPNLNVEVEPVVENLEIPWDMDHDSNGNLYLTERTGSVLRFDADSIDEVTEPADAIDADIAEDGWWDAGGEGGTLGLAVSPDDAYVYVYYTAEPNGLENRVVRYPIEDDELGEEEVVIDDIPADDRIHNGGRIAFGPDGYLWITTGDADDVDASRDPDSLAGKVLRVDETGEAAPDNPDHDGDDRIFAAGVRNAQGITWIDDIPIITDHGPRGHDATSLLYPAGDYGWPEVRGDDEDNYAEYPEVVPPLALADIESWATAGTTWYTGDDVPSWSNRLLVGTLTYQRLFVVTLTPPGETPPAGGTTHEADHYDQAATATVHEALGGPDEVGRIRHVSQGPDGELYLLTSNWDGRADGDFPLETDDRLLRVTAG